MNKKFTRNDNDDDENEVFFSSPKRGPLGFSVKTRQMHNFIVHINEKIEAPDYYSKIFDMLVDAGEEDIVSFFIASPGGRNDGLNVLLEGIRMTDAHTVAILVGACDSAASILALNCNEIVVTDSAEALVHSCRFGSVGKAADIAAHTAHTLKTTEKLARQTYGNNFLTESELNQMLDGKEFYFDADQLRERLERRSAFLEAEFKAKQNPEPAPKKPPAKKKAPVQK